MKAPLALEGARLAAGDVIRRTQLRGVESAGMLCSARELGLSDEHEGILELPDELVTGTPLREALRLDDTILTLNVTPNRGDVLSVLGVAREVAAIAARKLTPPALEPVPPVTREKFAVRLEAPAACPRFAGRVHPGREPGGPHAAVDARAPAARGTAADPAGRGRDELRDARARAAAARLRPAAPAVAHRGAQRARRASA